MEKLLDLSNQSKEVIKPLDLSMMKENEEQTEPLDLSVMEVNEKQTEPLLTMVEINEERKLLDLSTPRMNIKEATCQYNISIPHLAVESSSSSHHHRIVPLIWINEPQSLPYISLGLLSLDEAENEPSKLEKVMNDAQREPSNLSIQEADNDGKKKTKKIKLSVRGKKLANNLKAHMQNHTNGKRYSCSECRKSFPCLSSLKIHMIIHTNEKPYSCSICHKNFNVKGNMVRHMRSHDGVKPYSCSECGKNFSRSQNLKIHMLNHRGVKLYSCSECQKNFSLKGNLNRHMLIHTVKALQLSTM